MVTHPSEGKERRAGTDAELSANRDGTPLPSRANDDGARSCKLTHVIRTHPAQQLNLLGPMGSYS